MGNFFRMNFTFLNEVGHECHDTLYKNDQILLSLFSYRPLCRYRIRNIFKGL